MGYRWRLWGLLAGLSAALMVVLAGCSNVPLTPETIRNVTAAQLSEQHPVCLQDRNIRPPKAFVVKSENAWIALWGAGESPPKVDFEKNMVFVACTSLSSDGPGTMEVWVQKYLSTEETFEVRVREVIAGAWPLSLAYSRAYHMVKLPRTDLPVKVLWRHLWGNRDETRELDAQEWVPPAPTTGNAPQQGGYQTWGPQQR